MDVAAWVRAGRWRGLLELIDGLPRSSRLREAQLNDPEYVADLLELQGDDERPWAPAVSESTLMTDLLGALIGEVRALRSEAAVHGSGKQPRRVQPVPGPRTALEAARAERAERDAANILSKFGF